MPSQRCGFGKADTPSRSCLRVRPSPVALVPAIDDPHLSDRSLFYTAAGQSGHSRAIADRQADWQLNLMLYFILKAAISGVLIALVSTLAKRYPGWERWSRRSRSCRSWVWSGYGATVQTPRTWRTTLVQPLVCPAVPAHVSAYSGDAQARGRVLDRPRGCCALTVVLYLAMTWIAPRLGVQL